MVTAGRADARLLARHGGAYHRPRAVAQNTRRLRQVAATLDEIRRTSGAFSTRHRIIDIHGEVHHVVVVGDQLFGEDGEVIGTHGFYVDVTPSMRRPGTRSSPRRSRDRKARGGIEQAKGMLMLIYRINSDSAFELIKWRSQETNVKLRRWQSRS